MKAPTHGSRIQLPETLKGLIMSKRLLATVLAASLALTNMSAAPARAADTGEIARFIFGAGAVLMLGHALSNNNKNRNVTRRNDPGTVVVTPRRRVVPSACLRKNRWNNGPRRFFGQRCLINNMNNFARLPGGCRTTIWTNNGNRTVFSARCLRRNGWVFG